MRYAKALQERYHSEDAYPGCPRTISIGIAASDEGENLEELFQKVDARLYKAKAKGKACVEY